MSADTFLSRDEIREMTRTPIRARQVKFCRENGIRHYIDGNGWPVVMRSAVEGSDTANPAAGAWKSNKAA